MSSPDAYPQDTDMESLQGPAEQELLELIKSTIDRILEHPDFEMYKEAPRELLDMSMFVEVFDEEEALYSRIGRLCIRRRDGMTYVEEETQTHNKYGYVDEDIFAEWSISDDTDYVNLSGDKAGYSTAEQALENLEYLLGEELDNIGFVEIPATHPLVRIWPNDPA